GRFHEPSLVPLADMLTNTVGIMVFILIFTVLTAGGAVVVKRLPMERTSDAKPVHFVCAKGRIRPLNEEALVDDFMAPLGKPRSYGELTRWLVKFNAREVADRYFKGKGEGEASSDETPFGQPRVSLALALVPIEGVGDTEAELDRPGAVVATTLAQLDP